VRFRDAADLDAQLAKLLEIIVPGTGRHVSVKKREDMPPPHPQEPLKLAEEVQALPDAGHIKTGTDFSELTQAPAQQVPNSNKT
jgi:hypothetical protein